MERHELIELADAYKAALLDELQAKIALAQARRNLAVQENLALAPAKEAGAIDGIELPDTRKRRIAGVLTNDVPYQTRLSQLCTAEDNVGHATAGRQYYDALIGLTKAWLYSQSGH